MPIPIIFYIFAANSRITMDTNEFNELLSSCKSELKSYKEEYEKKKLDLQARVNKAIEEVWSPYIGKWVAFGKSKGGSPCFLRLKSMEATMKSKTYDIDACGDIMVINKKKGSTYFQPSFHPIMKHFIKKGNVPKEVSTDYLSQALETAIAKFEERIDLSKGGMFKSKRGSVAVYHRQVSCHDVTAISCIGQLSLGNLDGYIIGESDKLQYDETRARELASEVEDRLRKAIRE